MLSLAQEKLIKSLHSQRGRDKNQLWLVEGSKFLSLTPQLVKLKFSAKDSPNFNKLVTTSTPPTEAGLVVSPQFQLSDILTKPTILILDHIQDPGNLGTIVRLAGAFQASLILNQCVDPGNPKVIRSSAGLALVTPWLKMKPTEVTDWIKQSNYPIYRLENTPTAQSINLTDQSFDSETIIVIIGSEGQGISLPIKGTSLAINHQPLIDSINVATATAITLFVRYQKLYEQ